MLLATDSIHKNPIAGALVAGESKEETFFFLTHLKQWIKKPLSLVTIDFSTRILSGLEEVYPHVPIQKCVFHAIQLLTRGYIKELTRIKRTRLLNHIKEFTLLRRKSLDREKGKMLKIELNLDFSDTQHSLSIYNSLHKILSNTSPTIIESKLIGFFAQQDFRTWKGHELFLESYKKIFTERNFNFSRKALKYIIPKIYKAWRAAIRGLRIDLEHTKTIFNKAKYLVLMNPKNMELFHRRELRKCLKTFPWLRIYRKTLVKFYYQFKISPEKRRPLKFLTAILSENSHPRLKSAVQTLIENEENIFRYQTFLSPKTHTLPSKSIKVVKESANKTLNRLYRTQCGMRTIENLQMRISQRLSCPIIVSPSLKEKLNYQSKFN
ncbi:MAG: hypothetical protein GF311_19000 [Candidatus Lokiarchaeota archaeon]|nr:hypothetical protein [Candidatus Lokiarchaeota archaeon]